MSQKMVSVKEYNDVTNVIAKYVEAIKTGNIELLAETFHKSSITCGTVDGAFVGGAGSNPAVEFIKQNGKSPEIVSCIDVLDITPTTAVVRLISEKDAIGSDCTEYLTLIKLDGCWTIIGKVFHQF